MTDRRLHRILRSFPAVLLVGPRAVGKTTTARRYAQTVVRLDREAEAGPFQADPDAALRGLPEPVLLDEWQVVPAVLGAVKRAVDDDSRPGRFLLTGSVRADLDTPSWPGTGRLIRMTMWGLTGRERFGDPENASIVDRLLERGAACLEGPRSDLDLRDYVKVALASGFPEPVTTLSTPERDLWLDSYVEQLVTRDAIALEEGRDPERLRRYLEVLAANTAGIVEHQTLYESAGINRRTALAYEQLLVNVLVVERLPAWFSNRLKRLVRMPKRHLTDAALLAPVLTITEAEVLRDGDLLGRVLDSFVTAQVRAEVGVADVRCRLHHLRSKEGRQEIDVVVETPRGLIGMEIQATSAPDARSAAHLRWLREQVGDRFVLGIVWHTGPATYQLDERVFAAPIASLWA